ncbi:hypothetical protein [Luteibacter sp. RCC_6_2]|uniref:hypothetical protein n=1 Tax=Luteibacter sp. RCC_6_2 TaxID=3239223 RepID=UPI00352645BD
MSWVTEDTRAHGAQGLPGGISEHTGKWGPRKVKGETAGMALKRDAVRVLTGTFAEIADI